MPTPKAPKISARFSSANACRDMADWLERLGARQSAPPGRSRSLPKARRKLSAELLVGMQYLRAREELLFGLGVVGIGNAAVHRADGRALLLFGEPDTLRALLRDD